MKTHKLALLSVLVAFSSVVCAQDYAFKVLANKGNNEIKSGDNWQPLKTGATLKSGDEVKLSDNAYIGLVHNSGKPVEVKEAGVHKVSALESKVGTGSSVLNKYTDFILSSNAADAPKNRLSATGAVRRDITDATTINVFLPENDHSGIFSRTAIVNWDGSKVAGPYIVTVVNMFEDVLIKEETTGTSYEIDLSDEKLANEAAILIGVSSKADAKQASKQYMIKRLSPAVHQQITAAMGELKAELGNETAMNKLFLAGFYEQNSLLIDAMYAYEQAIKMEPEVPTFRESYDAFLLRNRLKQE